MAAVDWKSSQVWEVVREWAESELEAVRAQLERPITHDESSRLRGRIAALRALLSLPGEDRADAPPVRPIRYD